ncbi:MAG: copper amine oxidase N-terminal domain-containing protein [Caldisericia bacterium]
MKKLLSIVISIILIVSTFSAFSVGAIDKALADEGFNLYATAGDGVVKLWWDEVPNAKQGYYLYRGETSGGQYLMPLTDFGILGNVYFDKNVENGRNYCYYARALGDDAIAFAKSNEVCVSVLEDLPTLIEPCKLVLTFTIDSAEYMVNGVKKMMSTPCIVDNNRAFLLIRYVAEAVGAEVLWDGTERKVTVIYKDKTIEMWIDKSMARVNGVESPIDPNNPRVVPFIKNGRTHIPLRFPVESFGEGEVKWYAATKQAVLTFPDRCEETVEGLLVRYSDSTGLGHLKAFTGEPYLLANMNKLENGFKPLVGDCLRVTGRNDHEDYPGYLYVTTAEIIECPNDGLRNWEGKVIEKDCDSGAILFEDTNGIEQKISFPVGSKHLLGFCEKLEIDDCLRVSGKYALEEDKSIIIPENIETMDCPGETDEFECDGDWYSGKIIEIDCVGNSLEVELDSGDLVNVALPKNVNCMEMSDTWCIRFCGDRVSTDMISAKIVSAKPCNDNICDGILFSGRVLSYSLEENYLKLSQGETYITFDISGLNIPGIEDFECADVCAYKVVDSNVISTSALEKWVALDVNGGDCKINCESRHYQVKLLRNDTTGYMHKMVCGMLKSGEIIRINYSFDHPLLPIDFCYEICVDDDVLNPTIRSYKRIDFPISCDGLQVFGVLKKVTSSDATIQLYGSERTYSFSISETQAKKLEENMCIEACIKFELSGSASLTWFTELEPDECGITEELGCDGVELIVHIKEVDCDNNSMKIKIIDGHSMIKGMEMELPIDESIIKCSELENDSCAKVCGQIVGFTDFKLIWWEKIDPELCGIEAAPAEETCDEEVIGRIVYLGCREDDKIIIDVEGVEETYISKDVSVCKGFEIGDCVSACLKVIPGIPPVVLSMEKLDDKRCPEIEPECDRHIKINVENVFCEEGYIEGMEVLTVEARTPMPLKIHFKKTDFCEIKSGNCYEVCVCTDENGRYHGQNFMFDKLHGWIHL